MSTPQPVMIVDDDRDLGELLCELVSSAGYAVVLARNGAEALERLRSASPPPAVILLDLMMPVMDGWAFRDAQLRDPSLREIPVVVLTADAKAREKAVARKAEFSEFLTKPVDFEVLLEKVQRHHRAAGAHRQRA